MKRLLFLNVIVIVLVIALTAGATFAYFSAQDTSHSAKITTAKLGVVGWFSTPLMFPSMLPGDSVTQTIQIQNTSADAKEDFYLQMEPESPGGDTNFCYEHDVTGWHFTPKAWLKIVEEGTTVRYDNWICYLYPVNLAGEGGKTIALLSDDVNPGQLKTYTVTLTLSPTTGNAFQGKTNEDKIHLIAVQYNGPAPVTVIGSMWPVGDGNYGE